MALEDERASLPLVWVAKWVDFTSKYGLGFQLSNGNVGICFNDNTKMVGSGKKGDVKYIFKAPDNPSRETI